MYIICESQANPLANFKINLEIESRRVRQEQCCMKCIGNSKTGRQIKKNYETHCSTTKLRKVLPSFNSDIYAIKAIFKAFNRKFLCFT